MPGLPRERPCVVCGKTKRIEARGMCDACRKRQERNENACPDRKTGDDLTGMEHVISILKTLRKMKVLRKDVKVVIETLMPYSGTSFNYQQAFIAQHVEAFEFEGNG